MALPDQNLNLLLNISIVLKSGVELQVEHETCMLKFEVNDWALQTKPIVYRSLGLVPLAELQHFFNNVIIGDSALQRYLLTIAREKNRVGFAKSKNFVTSNRILAQLQHPTVASRSPTWLFVAAIVFPAVLLGLFTKKLVRNRLGRAGYTQIRCGCFYLRGKILYFIVE